MKPLERILAAVRNDPLDRPPVMPVLLQQGARALGLSLRDYFGDPKRLADGQTALVDRFGHDAVFAIPHVVQDTLAFGAGLTFHDEGPPSVNRMVIDRYDSIAGLEVPDPTKIPYLARTLQAATELAKRHKGERLIVGAVVGPFSLPSLLMGTGKFLDLLLRHADHRSTYLARLLDVMVEFTSKWANAQLAAGCDIVVFAEGIASATILSEKTFVADALPVLKRFCSEVKGLKALELVGDTLPFAKHVAALDVAAFLIGSNDPPAAMRQAIGNGRALIGNLNNLKLLRWNAERVRFAARRAIHEAGPGFILSNQGPEVPFAVPEENILALIEAARGRAEAPLAQPTAQPIAQPIAQRIAPRASLTSGPHKVVSRPSVARTR